MNLELMTTDRFGMEFNDSDGLEDGCCCCLRLEPGWLWSENVELADSDLEERAGSDLAAVAASEIVVTIGAAVTVIPWNLSRLYFFPGDENGLTHQSSLEL